MTKSFRSNNVGNVKMGLGYNIKTQPRFPSPKNDRPRSTSPKTRNFESQSHRFLLLREIGHLNDFTPHKGHLIVFQMCQIMRITVTLVSHIKAGIIGIYIIQIIPINQELTITLS